MKYEYTTIPLSEFPKVENSKITSERGNNLYDVPDDVEIQSIDADGKITWQHPTKFSEHPEVNVYLVSFEDGDFLFSGEKHSLLVYGEDGLTEVDTADSCGCFCVSQTIPPEVTVQDHVLASGEMGMRGVEGTQGKAMVEQSFKLELNRDSGLFLGMVLGDGWVDSMDILYLAGSTSEKIYNRKKFAELCNSSLLPYENGVKEIDRVSENLSGKMSSRGKTKVTCAWFNRWLKAQIGSGAVNKNIPSFSLNASEQHLMGILDGLISTDGTVHGDAGCHITIGICSSSIMLMTGLKVLAKRLGISYGIYVGKSPISGKPSYNLRFKNGSFKKFVERTGFTISHTLKQENLVKVLAMVKDNQPLYYVPAPPVKFRDEVITKLHGKWNKYGLARNVIKKGLEGNKIVLDMLTKIDSLIGCEMSDVEGWKDYFLQVSNPEVIWKQIRKVRFVQKTTAFDLDTNGPKNFLVNTCGVKNSDGDQLNVHVPATEEARKEVLEVMLPSKNLLSPKNFQPVLMPTNESALGLYGLSTENNKNTPKKFKTKKEVVNAYQQGKLSAADRVEVEG